MKKTFKIGALSLALVASLLLLSNTTNAIGTTGNLTLQITAGTNSCVYGTSLNLAAHAISTTAFAMTGTFATPATFFCMDNNGTMASWAMTLEATTDLTGTYGQVISRNGVTLKTFPMTMTGSCTTGAGTTTVTAIPAGSPGVIVSKTAALGQICTLSATGVQLAISVPANQAVGAYTGTLTLDRPF